MASISAIHYPLAINLRGQTRVLLASLPPDSPYAPRLRDAASNSSTHLVAVLSELLASPGLTLLIATFFRPILLELTARWLDEPQNTEDQLVALCHLLEVHEELFPVLHDMLMRPEFADGPIAFVSAVDSPLSVEVQRLQRLLLAYYRILQANRELPRHLLWSLSPLSYLIWSQGIDNGARLLAIRCYALQSGMGEAERETMERTALGELYRVECPLEYGHHPDGSRRELDAWVLPIFEVQRILEMRSGIVANPQTFYEFAEGDEAEPLTLNPRLVDVHGVLLLRSSASPPKPSPLIPTPTTEQALRALATHISLRLPTLLTSPPSSGKSLLLSHLAELLHPGVKNQIIRIHLADTSLDPRSLLGSYVSSPTQPGTFEWREGVLVRSMRQGRWIVLEDVDRGSSEVLGVLKPLVESLGPGKWIGQRATLEVPSRGRVVAADGFAIFATRSVAPSRAGIFPAPLFFGAHKFNEILLSSPTQDELKTIIDARFPRLAGNAARALIGLWETVCALGSAASTRGIGLRELEKFCARVQRLLPGSHDGMDVDADPTILSMFPNPTLREEMYLEARDIFFGAGATTTSARAHVDAIAHTIAQHLGLEPERSAWVLTGRTPELEIEKDSNARTVALRVGRTRLVARPARSEIQPPPARPFAMHRPAVLLLSRIATAVAIGEPVLLAGETGTGKTSAITHLAGILRRPLVSLNLSQQTESADLVGGFKPIDARVPGAVLHERFLELFGGTFSRRKNEKFEAEVRKAVADGRWKRAVGLWKESTRLAKERIRSKVAGEAVEGASVNGDTPRKRRKIEHALNVSEASWYAFEQDVSEFEVQHVHAKGKFAFGFIEGPLVKALRSGDWVLLDEINLASPETLECISGLLHSPTASITLTEQGSLEPVPRHPDFRLFACMNPATDVGKKDLPPNIRSRFTEIDVPPPDADRETLLNIVTQYIGESALGDKAAIMNVAEFYSGVKQLADTRQIADGSNHKPHYSMRTLARALSFAAEIAGAYSLRRAIWEGCLMAFTMVLDAPSAEIVTALAQKHLLVGVRNPRSMLMKEPSVPHDRSPEAFVKFGPFYLERGPLPVDLVEDYIMTPSVETKLIDLARIVLTRRFPVLIEGPTSSGKTSSVEYLAKRTGHQFIRINNHEHTDIQEYMGSYVSEPATGKLVFKDGLLVRALRNGDWIVLDELNLAPTDVLEALNRLLDDNRELVIPETQEVVRPNPHFMLFATQNPPGLYAGRKVLSRAFRNRFLEVHFEDVPQNELETILCQRCRIAPSYGKKIVSVFRELQKRRQSGRVFETKQGFATLRDLFRWAGRDAIGYQELAENGYMLLAERVRRDDDKAAVKDVIESIMNVKIDENAIYNLRKTDFDFSSYLDCPIPSASPTLIWTGAMQRLFILVGRALRFNEPVLLVGETGSGKTSVCQIFADASSKHLHGLNCHQNTETADLIGGLRPVRNRSAREAEVYREGNDVLQQLGLAPAAPTLEALGPCLQTILESQMLEPEHRARLVAVQRKFLRLKSIFEWHDGPLVDAMRNGDVFLLDEISLADDSVLERLNSVLEPGRTLVLAERGGDDLEHPAIEAVDSFKLIATMNPGGDYGKKELSPALRNRFTEIWVPPVDNRSDLELIVDRMWKFETLRPYTSKVLDFAEWLSAKVGDRSLMSLRDILAWVMFSNSVHPSEGEEGVSADEIFHHAAHMTFLDGLGSLPQLSAYSRDTIRQLRDEALAELQTLAPLVHQESHVPNCDPSAYVQLGTFAIARGPRAPSVQQFNLRAPTTQDNAMRVVRACQVPKPILLEGSPGVGKTSLVSALANIAGHHLCRINLSDQTDLIDLFGSDLPIEGGGPGEFAWKDAEFLTALQEGHWVLLDEMNLAPQAVLEGLNAILDHRGTVYIPELGRTFTRHPAFRIFAAQNPLNQGGGRKGLPKSFVNRFTKVYVEELTSSDLLLVCQHLFPVIGPEILQAMISFNTALNAEVSIKRSFARSGSPWEFNLRDVLRWATLLESSASPANPSDFLRSVYLDRFREVDDRRRARLLFDQIFQSSSGLAERAPSWAIAAQHLQFGAFQSPRQNLAVLGRPGRILAMQLPALETVGHCISQSWLAILTGPRNSGKTELVRTLANFSGRYLHEICVNSATDTMDILGSFEQVDDRGRVFAVVDDLSRFRAYDSLRKARRAASTSVKLSSVIREALSLIPDLLSSQECPASELRNLQGQLEHVMEQREGPGRFEWVDGPLVRAMKQGDWLLLDGANLCNPSVLDRLNSLCEVNGFLTLSERGYVDGQVQTLRPHPNFRIFMSVDPQYGELSRAMRNRGIEIALTSHPAGNDLAILQDHLRLPASFSDIADAKVFDALRRGSVLDTIVRNAVPSSSSGRRLDQDSASSELLVQTSLDTGSTSALAYFLARTTAPPYAPYFERFAAQTGIVLEKARVFSQAVPSKNLSAVIAHLWETYARSWGVPLDFVSAQPASFYLSPRRSTLQIPSPDHLFLRAIDLEVATYLFKDSAENAAFDMTTSSANSYSQARAVKEIDAVLENIQAVSASALRGINPHDWPSKAIPINLALKTIHYAGHLRKAIGNTHFDYSAVQAISNWLTDALHDCPPEFIQLANHVQALAQAVALSTGLGITEIWSKFLASKISDFPSTLVRLDDLARHLEQNPATYDLRRQCFDLMCLNSLNTAASDDEITAFAELHNDIFHRLESVTHKPTESQDKADVASLIPELGIIASLWDMQGIEHENLVRAVEQLIQTECRQSSSSLLSLTVYQHLIWALNAEKDIFPIIVRLQMQWLNNLWTTADDDGPAILFRPSQLRSTMSDCDLKGSSLVSFGPFETNLQRRVRLTHLQCEHDSPRIEQLARVLQQAILLMTSCFASSVDDAFSTSPVHELDARASLNTTLAFVEQTKNRPFKLAIQRHLRPSLQRFCSQKQSHRRSIAELGLCWIGLSRVIFDLFIPDAPVDPAAIRHCATGFWRQQESLLSDQISLHSRLEHITTGNSENIILSYLREQLAEVLHHLCDLPTLPLRGDVSRLHMFWSEVSQFQNHIISPAKIDALLSTLGNFDESALLRENVVQRSMAGFCQRLDSVYPEYADISGPLQLATLYLRMGLRLIASTSVSDSVGDHVVKLASSLAAFPSVEASRSILAESESGPLYMSPFGHLLMNLAALAADAHTVLGIELQVEVIHTIYSQVQRLWLIDRAREGEEEAASSSLYRHKPLDHDDLGEAEMEEREFLILFPSFEDALDPDSQNLEPVKGSQTGRIQSADIQQLVDLHFVLLLPQNAMSCSGPEIFHQLRKSTLRNILQTHFSSLSDVLDAESLPLQLSLLRKSVSSTQTATTSPSAPYNFYADANILEAKKAATVTTSLKMRLQVLIQEWPDQMVLQHLVGRCDAVLALDLGSPVAKVLSALEQLLVQTADWEIYANRHNTLKEHQSALTTLIVEWRRLELACWQVLLQSQAKTFADGISEWWFHIYDATIRGPLDAAHPESQDPTQSKSSSSLSDYLATLVPLLDDFIRGSPLGQFQARMQLLRSFEVYCVHLAGAKAGTRWDVLDRVRRILHATQQFYNMFSLQVSKKLSEQRNGLEKELKGFIKLASWKDINVQALKASAQRTHHQLYKIIRKFRDVLRQPVASHLLPQYAGDTECQRLDIYQPPDTWNPLSIPSFPRIVSTTAPSPHLLDLAPTFRKFGDLIHTRIKPFISASSALIVDNLAVDIIVTTRQLATVAIASTPAEKREKQQKALMVRKRKAWSDLLKELKRAGFSANVKPDTLREHSDARWIRERPILECDEASTTVAKSEEYYNRLHGALPDLRSSLSGHHPDLVTRDLQKGVMFVESVFVMAVDSRSRLADAFVNYNKLQRLSRRLNVLVASPKIAFYGTTMTNQLQQVHIILCKLLSALKETNTALNTFNDLNPTPRIENPLLEEVRTLESSTEILCFEIKRICDNADCSSLPILLEDERAVVTNAIVHLTDTSTALELWAGAHPRLRYLFIPVKSWLDSQPTVSLSSDTEPPATVENPDTIIDLFLVHVQSMLSVCPESVSKDEDSDIDRYIEQDYHNVRNLTRLLKLSQTLDSLNDVFRPLAVHGRDIQLILQRFLPFLETYLQLVHYQLTTHSEWTKALFKLDYVLCSVTQTIAKDGFCKPPDNDEADTGGETSELSGGMGLGAGEGSENVSKEIEEESQVEGLKGDDDESKDPKDKDDDHDAIEMSEDIGGSLEDVPEDDESKDEKDSDQGSNADPEEQLGELDASDPSAVDEKLWGDEQGPSDSAEKDDKTNQDHSEEKSGNPEVVAKESNEQPQPKEKKDGDEQSADPEPPSNAEDEAMAGEEDQEDRPDAGGAPVDDYVKDANTLDLPDDMDLGLGEDMPDEMDVDQGPEDDEDDDAEPASDTEPSKESTSRDEPPSDDAGDPLNQEQEPLVQSAETAEDNETPEDGEVPDEQAVAQPDVTAGEGQVDPNDEKSDKPGESAATGQAGSATGVAGEDTAASEEKSKDEAGAPQPSEPSSEPPAQASESEIAGTSADGPQEGQAQSQSDAQLSTNPLRSLGDALKEIRQRFDRILDADESQPSREQPVPTDEEAFGAEHLRPEDADHDMQALGPAGEEQVAKLNELTLMDLQQESDMPAAMEVDRPPEVEQHQQPSEIHALHEAGPFTDSRQDVDGAVSHSAPLDSDRHMDPSAREADVEMEDDDDVELELRQWQANGIPDEGAERIWRLYESLTHDLAYALCEQLRLILEPTLATRLKGDYRTGKRLNMKKIIPYIASDYTKDKIWLRRTRPSQREYQVLISLDDSKSMAESHSVHLAFETLALVSKALSRLEAGDVAIAKFGERVDILHGFDEGPFTDQAGSKLMSAFRFDQKATNVLSLVETSLRVLEAARERRAMSSASAADLWQLEIIISDGMCQDHEKLRTVLRKAEEQRVMIVFIIVDSLHSAAAPSAASGRKPVVQGSILTMDKAEYKNVDGRMELQLQRYLDSFPFEYYVVLRSVEALPEVLAGTLRQFFQRISEE
ncbi:midasin nuclear AAA ATPase [Mycena belliarum]|uniref:Midasin n=1 Tax=Mycena belliarum TaxID=1033014 RepID=A0AAD6U1T6_9AGAR|nr:midasin nuclear AAA ATPase [Mycena belliae]